MPLPSAEPPHRRPLSAPALGALLVLPQVLALVLALVPALCGAELGPASQREIDGLLRAVATSNCEFIRNGSAYTAAEAQRHLLDKYEYLAARAQLASAEDFIDKAAARSSMSGQPYVIRCAGAAAQRSEDWLKARLRLLRQPQAPR